MNKKELAASVMKKTGMAQRMADEAISAIVETVQETLQKGEKVQLVGFGTFEVQKREARVCKNLHTGETMNVPATMIPKFKAGKILKDAVKNL